MGKLVRVEGAAREIAAFKFNRGYLSPAVVDPKDKILGFRIFVNIDFSKDNSVFAKELLGPAAIPAPICSVNGNLRHLFHL